MQGTADHPGFATARARFATAHPWLMYLVVTPLAHPILENLLFGARALQTAHDVFDDDIPRLFSIAADWKAFGPSLWDTHLTAGNALFAQWALPPLAPDVLFSLVLTPFAAYVLNAALMAFLAGLSMHLFLRDSLRLPAVACFVGGIAATFAFWHYIYGYAALLLPLALLWSERAAAPGARRRDVVLLALLVAFMAISSQVQIVALVAGVSLVWVVVTAPAAREAAGRAARFFVPWLAGAAIASPVLLTQLLAIGDSQREIWTIEPIRNVLGAWLQQLSTIPLGVEVAGYGAGLSAYGSWFPGVIGLPLLFVSLAIPRAGRHERAALALLGGLLVADALAMLVIPLQDDVSLLASFQFVRVRHLVPAAILINVALAVAWLVRPGALAALARWRAVLLAALALGSLAVLAVQARAASRPIRQWLREDGSLAAPSQELAASLLIAAAFVAGIAALVVVVALALRHRAWRSGHREAPGALLGAAAVACLLVGLIAERATFVRGAVYADVGVGAWADWVPPTSAHEFIADQPGGGRSVSVIEHANRQLSAGLYGVDGYEVIYPLRYHALFGALIRPQTDASPNTAAYFGEWGNRAYAFSPGISKPIADLLGVRWLLVAGEEHIDPSLRSRFAVQLPVDPGFVARFDDDGRVVYENPDAFPRAFIVHATEVHADRDAAVEALVAASSEELRTVAHLVAAEAPRVQLPAQTATADANDRATLVVDTPDRIEIQAHADRAGMLILADTFARGWVAKVDGGDAPIHPVDVALRGVVLPAGDHTVTFEYRPVETYFGFVLAAVTLLGLLAWLAFPWLRTRREAVPDR